MASIAPTPDVVDLTTPSGPHRALAAWEAALAAWPTNVHRAACIPTSHHRGPDGQLGRLEVAVVAGDNGGQPVVELESCSWHDVDGHGQVLVWGDLVRLNAAETAHLIAVLTAAHDLAVAAAVR